MGETGALGELCAPEWNRENKVNQVNQIQKEEPGVGREEDD